MERLTIAQFYNINADLSKEMKRELLRTIKIDYCIPDTLPFEQIKTEAGYTSLHLAVEMKDLELIDELLGQGADLVKQCTSNGHSPLHVAYKNSYFDESFGKLGEYNLINFLLSKQVEIEIHSNPKRQDGISHFHIACMVNHAKAVEFFTKAKEPLNESINSNAECLAGYTPLHCAIEYSSVESAGILLGCGADVHVKNAKGMSGVHLLIKRIMKVTDHITTGVRTLCLAYKEEIERLEAIIILTLKANKEIFADDTGLTALHVACILRDKALAEDFLNEGAEVNRPVNSGSKFWPGWTSIHFAASFSIEMMILLMQRGANVIMKNLKGETALDLCAKRFNPTDVQLILSMENEFKDIMLLDSCTKLSDLLVAMNKYDQFVEFLKKLQDVNVIIPLDSPIWPGFNLLHLSASFNDRSKSMDYFEDCDWLKTLNPTLDHYNCTEEEAVLYNKRIELCLEYGCSVDMKNADGQTPIQLAFGASRKETVEQLLGHSNENVIDGNGLSHLHIACALSSLDSVKKYLSKGTNVNSRVRSSFTWGRNSVKANSTPLHVAVIFGHQEIVKCLLQSNADVHARDSLGLTPVHCSVSGYCGLGRTLLKATSELRNSVSSHGLSHLHVAAYFDDQEAVDKLLLKRARVNRVVDASVKEPSFLAPFAGKTPLLVAVDRHASRAIESLLKAGANVHTKDLAGISALQRALCKMSSSSATPFVRLVKNRECEVESCGMTPLHVACGTGDIEWAKQLLQNGVDVNVRIRDGQLQGATPLYLLVNKDRFSDANRNRVFLQFVELLVGNGADVTIERNGNTPLHLIYGCTYGYSWDYLDVDEASLLLRAADLMLKSQKCYDVNPIDEDDFSHFHLACMRNDVETATKFLDHGVDVNASINPFVDVHPGSTSLHFALAHRCKDVAHLLLDRGADVNARDMHGNAPLHVALKKKFVNLPLIETIISLGADIHAKNLNNETLLYCLLGYGGLTLEAFEFFLNRGCSINILDAKNESGQGILGLAMSSAAPNELQAILEKLLQHSEIKSAVQGGFGVVESIVSTKNRNRLTLDDYLNAIESFVNIGCDLDQRDTRGVTVLHAAAYFYNQEAVDALLHLGADLNAIDNKKYNCPFLNEFDADEDDDDDDDETRYTNVSKALACHAWKMRFIELELKESILRCLERVEQEFQLDNLLERPCQDELTKAEQTKICQGLTVKDFLSDLGAVAEYPRMGSIRQSTVDKFFNNAVDLRREFPAFCGLLAFQYRKVLCRMTLCHPAKEAIVLICKTEIPDLCLEAILRYFTNNEMKLLIDLVRS